MLLFLFAKLIAMHRDEQLFPKLPSYLRHKQYSICVLSSRKLIWPLAKNCTRLISHNDGEK